MKYSLTPEIGAGLILRTGLLFVFAYAGIDALREPAAWIGFLPTWTSHFGSAKNILDIFSFIQLVVAAALVYRPFVTYAAFIAALMLLGISVTNLASMLVVFRDFGLVALALGLAVLDFPARFKL